MTYDGSEPYLRSRRFILRKTNIAIMLKRAIPWGAEEVAGTLLAGAGDMAVYDKWAPVRDSENTWIHTGEGGGYGFKRCWTHFEQGYGKSRWGVTGLTDSEGGEGRGLCCASVLLSALCCFC